MPPSVLDSMLPDCGVTDINGDFFSVLTGGNVATLQTIQVRCCIDSNTIPNACDPEEPQDSVFVDINPQGVPPPIELSAEPSVIPPGGQSTITAMTTPPEQPPTEICFEIVVDSSAPSMLNGGPCVAVSSLGEAVIGLIGGNVTTQESVTVRGCIDVDMSGACDGTDPSGFVTVVISAPTPTPTPGPTPAATETGNMLCANGMDDDMDTFTDCADPGCAAASACEFPESTCGDGFDNDGDGNIDCADSNCDNQSCGVGVTCDFGTTTCS
jgi:hypothetical protein